MSYPIFTPVITSLMCYLCSQSMLDLANWFAYLAYPSAATATSPTPTSSPSHTFHTYVATPA